MNRPRIEVHWPIRLLVILVSLALHGALLVWLLSATLSQPLPEQPQPIAVQWVEEPAVVPEPEPQPEPELPEPEPIAELPPEPPPAVKPPVVKKTAPPPRAPTKPAKAAGPQCMPLAPIMIGPRRLPLHRRQAATVRVLSRQAMQTQ